MPLIPKGDKLVTDAADRLEMYSKRAAGNVDAYGGATPNGRVLDKDAVYIDGLRKLAPTLDRRKLLALRLELPGAVWDDAIKPILDAMQP